MQFGWLKHWRSVCHQRVCWDLVLLHKHGAASATHHALEQKKCKCLLSLKFTLVFCPLPAAMVLSAVTCRWFSTFQGTLSKAVPAERQAGLSVSWPSVLMLRFPKDLPERLPLPDSFPLGKVKGIEVTSRFLHTVASGPAENWIPGSTCTSSKGWKTAWQLAWNDRRKCTALWLICRLQERLTFLQTKST